jgi:hypothetical protein
LFNYSGGISRDSGHIVRENVVRFRGGAGRGFINQTTPANTIVENNNWQAQLD